MLTAAAYDLHMDQLFERMRRFHEALTAADVPYRIVGGLATFMHVYAQNPESARATTDIDAGVRRSDLPRVIAAAEAAGFQFRHAAGIDMLLDIAYPKARSAVHLVMLEEKIRSNYLEPVPASEPVRTVEGYLIAPVADLVRMKLTSFRLKDKVHIQDLDSVGLITTEIEVSLSEPLHARLAEVRATE